MTRRDRGRTSEITVKPGQEKEGALHTEDRQSHQKLDRKKRGRGHTGYPNIARGPEREEREATGLEKKTRGRPPRTPKHEELKSETLEKGPPGLEPTREQRTKRSQKATKGPEDHPKISRRNTRGREREIEDAASENNEGRQEEEPVAKGTTMRSKERMAREGSL